MERLTLKHKAPTEKDITAAIRNFLAFKRIWHFKLWQGLGSYPGAADIIGIVNGRMLAIEVKSPTGRLNPKQERFLAAVNFHGGIAFVARSVTDVMENLKGEICQTNSTNTK